MNQTLLGGGSPLNKLKQIETHLSRNARTVYVELDGNDVKADGSVTKPFATVARALLEKVGTTHELTIMLGVGSHSTDKVVCYGGRVNFKGEGKLSFAISETSLIGASDFGIVAIYVDVIDEQSPAYSAAFSFAGGGQILIYNNNVTLVNASDSLFYNGHGQNAAFLSGSVITSSKSILKHAGGVANTEPLSFIETGVTYSNIN